MAGKTGKDCLYTRVQGSTGIARYYADLRDLGGGQLALRAPGSSRATTDLNAALEGRYAIEREIARLISTGGKGISRQTRIER